MSGSNQSSPNAGFNGIANDFDNTSVYNAVKFIVSQELAKRSHAMPVKVIAVHGGGVGAPSTVDVQVMINQVDGQGNNTAHGTIYGVPVHRPQSGSLAIIMDPLVGDKGLISVCDRDISSMIANGAVSGPGSSRQNSYSDAVYMSGLQAVGGTAAPTTFIQITPEGITITTPGVTTINTQTAVVNASSTVAITATNITLDTAGNLMVTGHIIAGGDVTANSSS